MCLLIKGKEKGFTAVELIVIALLIAMSFFVLIPGCTQGMRNAFGTEMRANLDTIRAAIERYAVDHDGAYPQFLLGGDKLGWDPENGCDAFSKRPPYADNLKQTNRAGGGARPPLDPLISGGYLESYPSNPFLENFKKRAPEFSGGEDGKPGTGDVRFGFDGTKMGNVMDDPRFLWDVYVVFDQPDKQRLQPTRLVNTFSPSAFVKNFGSIHPRSEINPFYSMGGVPSEKGELTTRWWPGQFLYRATGRMKMKDNIEEQRLADESKLNIWDFEVIKYEHYILAAYGSLNEKGMDLVRITTIDGKAINNHSGMTPQVYNRSKTAPYDENVTVFMSPPDVFGGGAEGIAPIFPPYEIEGDKVQIIYGAPDGYPDGLLEPIYTDDKSTNSE